MAQIRPRRLKETSVWQLNQCGDYARKGITKLVRSGDGQLNLMKPNMAFEKLSKQSSGRFAVLTAE